MRVLCVGNMYPPHHQGGYELIWRATVEHLRGRGHDVRVLTTEHREPGVDAPDDPDVHRELRWYWRDFAFPRLGARERIALERHNHATLLRHLDEHDTEVVAWWAMGGMSLSLIEHVRRAGLPALALVIDDWLDYGLRADGWLRLARRAPRLAGRLTGLPARVDFGAAATYLFTSEHTRERARRAGHELPRAAVAHPGFDGSYLERATPPGPWAWRLLYVGRIDARKGIRTAVRALAELPEEATLTIVGSGDGGEAEALRDLAADLGVGDRVEHAGPLPRAELPGAFAAHDVTLFPVEWEEPWGLVPLESMALGRPVIATGRGGSGEYLSDGENCLLHPPGDAAALAACVELLAGSEELRARLVAGGRATAPRYTEERFNCQVESALARVLRGGRAQRE